MKLRYFNSGCYRFLDDNMDTIYIGCSKNIDRRLSSHFKNGHLSQECYSSVCAIDIIKTENYADALSLEQKLIEKYRPEFNKRDKPTNIFSNVYDLDELEEPWKFYKSFRNFKPTRLYVNKLQVWVGLAITYVCFIAILITMYSKVL